MSNSFNFSGRLGGDSERKQAGNSTILEFSVSNSTGFGDRKKTEWFKCSLFGKQADGNLMDYLRKGTLVFISGELTFSEYNGKTYKNVNIKSFDILGQSDNSQKPQQTTAPQYGKGNQQNGSYQQQGGYGQQNQTNSFDDGDGLPF